MTTDGGMERRVGLRLLDQGMDHTLLLTHLGVNLGSRGNACSVDVLFLATSSKKNMVKWLRMEPISIPSYHDIQIRIPKALITR